MDFNTLETQTGKLGRPFRQVSVTKVGEGKFINRVERWHWLYTLKYLDNNKMFSVEVDFDGKICNVNQDV